MGTVRGVPCQITCISSRRVERTGKRVAAFDIAVANRLTCNRRLLIEARPLSLVDDHYHVVPVIASFLNKQQLNAARCLWRIGGNLASDIQGAVRCITRTIDLAAGKFQGHGAVILLKRTHFGDDDAVEDAGLLGDGKRDGHFTRI